jgi:hypothetical protein
MNPASRLGDLLLHLSEELKQSLVSIALLSEMGESPEAIASHARVALKTIDNVLLYHRVHSGQTSLVLEPVHVGSTIHAVAHTMEQIMRASGCRTELNIQHGLSPVDADRHLLESALYSLWQAVLQTVTTPSEIICNARKTPGGVRLSIHSRGAQLETISLNKKNLNSLQPLTAVSGSAMDFLAAEGLFALLGSNLNKSIRDEVIGLGVTLLPSRQLQMI